MKQPLKKVSVKSDTTVIPKPYKVLPKELGEKINGKVVFNMQDSTSKKIKYNNQTIKPAIAKRNKERVKEKLAPIKQDQVLGQDKMSMAQRYIGLSDKGKTFKESPLKTVKKKK